MALSESEIQRRLDEIEARVTTVEGAESGALDTRLDAIESAASDLDDRVTALENA